MGHSSISHLELEAEVAHIGSGNQTELLCGRSIMPLLTTKGSLSPFKINSIPLKKKSQLVKPIESGKAHTESHTVLHCSIGIYQKYIHLHLGFRYEQRKRASYGESVFTVGCLLWSPRFILQNLLGVLFLSLREKLVLKI